MDGYRPRRRRGATRAWALVALCAASIGGLEGCAGSGTDVGAVGDSITVQLTPYLEGAAEGEFALEVAAVSGATVGEMVDDAAVVAATGPSVLVVNLGSNDVIRGVPPEQSAADLERLLNQFSGVRCLVLVTVNENMFSYTEGFLTDRAVATNAALAEVGARRGAVVVDWNAILDAQRALPDTPDMLLDTIHVTPYGAEVLTAAYVDAVTTGCSSDGG